MNKWNREQGFTLVEAMIALFILMVGIMSLYTMQIAAIQGNQTSNRITVSSAWAQNQIEGLMMKDLKELPAVFSGPAYTARSGAYPGKRKAQVNYSDGDIPSLDRTDDGRAFVQDTDKNGFDDTGVDAIPNFGLDAATAASADWWEPSPDGRFNLYYNFAIDVPFPKVVTVRVLVQEVNSTAPPAAFTYIKDDII